MKKEKTSASGRQPGALILEAALSAANKAFSNAEALRSHHSHVVMKTAGDPLPSIYLLKKTFVLYPNVLAAPISEAGNEYEPALSIPYTLHPFTPASTALTDSLPLGDIVRIFGVNPFATVVFIGTMNINGILTTQSLGGSTPTLVCHGTLLPMLFRETRTINLDYGLHTAETPIERKLAWLRSSANAQRQLLTGVANMLAAIPANRKYRLHWVLSSEIAFCYVAAEEDAGNTSCP